MRPVGNALELKLCKIPTIGTQSENQTLPTGNISLGSPIVFSGWALHCSYPKTHPWESPYFVLFRLYYNQILKRLESQL
ncbi:hypothetical protein [Helicobacter pylori]|uniref:hypothetical protein n=1 Tax=Helicobacter pylori TaxID=210 RepID=UPI00281208B4|nr:hypothetical protein [Helicobacter pylori]